MAHRSTALSVVIFSAALVMGACGSEDTKGPPPTAEELAASLIAADDYPGDWTINVPPDATGPGASGVVPDEFQDMLPQLELCDAASIESRAAAAALTWKAFRQLDLTVEDPIRSPERTGRMIFAQEFLTSAEPAEIETTFNLLRDGMRACLGDIPAGEEGPGTAAAMSIPDVGDDRYGVLALVEEAGGGAEWRLHSALVRSGPVLMLFDVVEIRAGEGVDARYSINDVAEFLSIAVDKL